MSWLSSWLHLQWIPNAPTNLIYRALLIMCNCYYHIIMSCFPCVYPTGPSPAPCWILVSPSSCLSCSSFVQRDWRQVAARGLGHDDAPQTYPRKGKDELGERGRRWNMCACVTCCICIWTNTETLHIPNTVLWMIHVYLLDRLVRLLLYC